MPQRDNNIPSGQAEIENFIQRLPSDINPLYIDDLYQSVTVISLVKGETFIYEKEKKQKIYYILKGSCVRFIINPAGEERAVMFHTENFMSMVGNMYIDSSDSVVTYLLKANEDMLVLELDSSFGLKWIDRDHAFARYIFQTSIQYLSTINQIQNHLLGLSSEDFLRWLLKKYGFIFQRFRSMDIANFMGVTPIWLSNLKRKITQNNL